MTPAVEDLVQSRSRVRPLINQMIEIRLKRLSIQTNQATGLFPHQTLIHIKIPDVSQRRSKPGEFRPESLHFPVTKEAGQKTEGRPQAPDRHAHLVHALRINPLPRPGFLAQQVLETTAVIGVRQFGN